MRYSFKNEVSHLEKINSLSKEVLINSRFLRNNSMKEIHNNNKIELMKKCYSNYISPKFKENYYDIITCVLPDNNVKSISSYTKDNNSKNLHTNFLFKSFKKNEKIKMKKANYEYSFIENMNKKGQVLHKKKSEILSIINKKQKQNKKKNFIKSNSSKNILTSKDISFILNQNSFLNQFENLKKKCNNINNNNSGNLSHSINLYNKNLILLFKKKIKNYKINSKDYSPFFKDSFYNEKNDLQSELSSHQKIYAGVLKFNKKLNLYKL